MSCPHELETFEEGVDRCRLCGGLRSKKDGEWFLPLSAQPTDHGVRLLEKMLTAAPGHQFVLQPFQGIDGNRWRAVLCPMVAHATRPTMEIVAVGHTPELAIASLCTRLMAQLQADLDEAKARCALIAESP